MTRDPLSPLVFNFVADMLTLLISRTKEEGGLSILQYAYNTILSMEHNIEQLTNLKLLLCVFEQLSGLKINFTRVNYFVIEKQNSGKTNTLNSLVVESGNTLSNI
jgi:hypothetical protein